MDNLLFKIIFPWLWKVVIVVVGVVFSLILSGDIDKEGKCTINIALCIKILFGVIFSLVGGEFFIVHYGYSEQPIMYQGFIMILFAIFALLVIGILYQSVAMWKGKSFSEIVVEVKDTIRAILK